MRGIDLGVAVRVDDTLDHFLAHFEDVVLERRVAEQLAAAMVHDLALLVHHVVVFEQMLAHVEVVGLDLLLRVLDRAADPAMLDRHVVFHPDAAHQVLEPVGAENPEQVVFEREEKARAAGIALPSRTAAELIVDPARLVPLGAEDVQAAGREHQLALRRALGGELFQRGLVAGIHRVLGARFGGGHQLGVAAQHDIGAAARHIGGNRDCLVASGLRDDFGLALVVLGVQHMMGNAGLAQQGRDPLGLFDRNRADQHRLSALVAVLDLLDHGVELLALGLEHHVVIVDPDHRLVGRDHGYFRL